MTDGAEVNAIKRPRLQGQFARLVRFLVRATIKIIG